MKKTVIWGVLLVLAGVYFLLSTLFNLPAAIFLLFLGVAFLAVRCITGRYGYTIPGSLLAALGLGLTLQHYLPFTTSGAALTLLCLSLGFLVMHLIDFRRMGNWPLIPALVLFLVSALLFVTTDPALRHLLEPYFPYLLPVVLILLGVIFLLRALFKGRQGDAPAGNAPRQERREEQVPPCDYYMPPKAEPTTQRPEPQPEPQPSEEEKTKEP